MRRHFSISGRLGAALALFAGVLAIAGPADAAEKPYGLEVGVASQYVGKGLDKSDGRAALSGTFRVQGGPFYASAFASSAHVKQGGDSEVILTVGAKQD